MTHLVAAIWQGCVITAVVDILLRLSRSLSSSTRHVVWWATLAAVCVLTVWHLARSIGDSVIPSIVLSDTAASSALILPAPPRWMVPALAALWLVSVFRHGWRLASALRAITILRQHARPLDEAIARALPHWSRLAARDRRAALVVSNHVAGACAVGLSRRPLIVLSERLVGALDSEALDQIVLHERAHLVRRDDWTRALQWLVTACFGLHPAVLLINRRLEIERETACDDEVVAETGSAAGYAAALALAADVTAREDRWPSSLVPGAAEGGTLFVRVRRLLDPGTQRTRGLQAVAVAASIATLTAITTTASGLSPIVVVAGATSTVSARPPMADPASNVPPERERHADPAEAQAGAHATAATHERRAAATRPHRLLKPPADGSRQDGTRTGGRVAVWTSTDGASPTSVPSFSPALATSADAAAQPTARMETTQQAPLASTSIGHDIPMAAPTAPSVRVSAASAWTTTGAVVAERLVRFGTATGRSSRQTGESIAGFFSRSGKALAARF